MSHRFSASGTRSSPRSSHSYLRSRLIHQLPADRLSSCELPAGRDLIARQAAICRTSSLVYSTNVNRLLSGASRRSLTTPKEHCRVHHRSSRLRAEPDMGSRISKQGNDSKNEIQPGGPGSEAQGLLLMAGVAMMWGTSPPCTRALYALEGPPSPAALGTLQATMAFIWLSLLNRFASHLPWAQPPPNQHAADGPPPSPSQSPSGLRSPPLSNLTDDQEGRTEINAQPADEFRAENSTLLQHLDFEQPEEPTPGESSILHRMRATAAGVLNQPASSQLAAGAELGAISAAANAATLLGFEDTLAARGAFLLRTSVMFTPILAAVAGQTTPTVVWIGAGTAFAGGLLIAGDDLSSQGQQSSSLLSLSGGDGMLILAALLWALQIVRQGRLARCYPPLALAANQLGFMALGLGFWLALNAAREVSNGHPWTAVWPGWSNPMAWLIALWPAIFPWGLGGVLQLRAQTMVSPSLTNIVLATDPLWATLFSAILGTGEQRLGLQGWLGGGAIVLACIIAGQAQSSPKPEEA